MNFADFNQGRNVAARRADAAIDEWEEHSNQLKQRLRIAETSSEDLAKQRIFESAKVDGFRAVIAAMEGEIRRLNPNSPLLQQATKDNIASQRMAEYLSPHGYHYDTKTYKVTKLTR